MKLHGLAPLATDLYLRMTCGTRTPLATASCHAQHAEGWHRGFNSMLRCSNPTIWKFPDCVKAEQSLTDLKKNQENDERKARAEGCQMDSL